jgi:hypothetical protein
VNNPIGEVYTLTDGEITIPATLSDLDKVKKAYKLSRFDAWVIRPRAWSIVVSRRAAKIEVSLEVRDFQVSDVKVQRINPAKGAFRNSELFRTISNLAQMSISVENVPLDSVEAPRPLALENTPVGRDNAAAVSNGDAHAGTVAETDINEELNDQVRQLPLPKVAPNVTAMRAPVMPQFQSSRFDMTDFSVCIRPRSYKANLARICQCCAA